MKELKTSNSKPVENIWTVLNYSGIVFHLWLTIMINGLKWDGNLFLLITGLKIIKNLVFKSKKCQKKLSKEDSNIKNLCKKLKICKLLFLWSVICWILLCFKDIGLNFLNTQENPLMLIHHPQLSLISKNLNFIDMKMKLMISLILLKKNKKSWNNLKKSKEDGWDGTSNSKKIEVYQKLVVLILYKNN